MPFFGDEYVNRDRFLPYKESFAVVGSKVKELPNGKFQTLGKFRTHCAAPNLIHHDAGAGVKQIAVTCGKCPHCRWTQREAIANQTGMDISGADWSFYMTFTVAPDMVTEAREDIRLDVALHQNLMKRVRINSARGVGSFADAGPNPFRDIRFLCAGEYGSLKGRAHYHYVVWGRGTPPAWATVARTHIPEWGLGHVNITADIGRGVAFYIAKYVGKGGAGDADTFTCRSSKIGLGALFAVILAERQVALGFPIPNAGFVVTFEGHKAILRGAARRDYLRAFAYARNLEVRALADICPDVMRSYILRIDKWERRRIEAISLRDGVTFDRARYRLRDEFDLKYKGIPSADGFVRSPESLALTRERRLRVEGGRMMAASSRKNSVRKRGADISGLPMGEREAKINRMVNRGEYVSKKLLPLPHALRSPEMDRAARAKDRERAAAVQQAARLLLAS